MSQSRGWVIVYKGKEMSDPMPKNVAQQKLDALKAVFKDLELREAVW